MLPAVVICYPTGACLVERFNGISAEERRNWLSFLEKLGADKLQGVQYKELLFACYKSVCITGTVFGNFHIFSISKDKNDGPSTDGRSYLLYNLILGGSIRKASI